MALNCHYVDDFDVARQFLSCSGIDWDAVRVVHGCSLVTSMFGGAPAMATGNLVMINPDVYNTTCMGVDVMVHELTHVWKHQHHPMHMAEFISWAEQQANNRSGMYDYGNLTHAMLTNKSYFDFNLEQQAEIVEDYYSLVVSRFPNFFDHAEALRHYARVVLNVECDDNHFDAQAEQDRQMKLLNQ